MTCSRSGYRLSQEFWALPTETAVEANSGSELAPRRSNRAVRGRKRFMLIRLIAE